MLTTVNLSQESDRRKALANKVMVDTKSSTDGRSTDYFYVDYSPEDPFALVLLERVLNTSPDVKSYCVFGNNGSRLINFDSKSRPKRI